MSPLSRKRRGYTESVLVRLAYIPVMAVIVVGVVLFIWPVETWNDYRLRRAWRRQWGSNEGRVVIPFTPGTPWHDAILARWIPRYGDRTSLVDLTTLDPKSRALEDRVYRRWQPHYPAYARPPVMIVLPPRGRVLTISFADAMEDPAALERLLDSVARRLYSHGDDPLC